MGMMPVIVVVVGCGISHGEGYAAPFLQQAGHSFSVLLHFGHTAREPADASPSHPFPHDGQRYFTYVCAGTLPRREARFTTLTLQAGQ